MRYCVTEVQTGMVLGHTSCPWAAHAVIERKAGLCIIARPPSDLKGLVAPRLSGNSFVEAHQKHPSSEMMAKQLGWLQYLRHVLRVAYRRMAPPDLLDAEGAEIESLTEVDVRIFAGYASVDLEVAQAHLKARWEKQKTTRLRLNGVAFRVADLIMQERFDEATTALYVLMGETPPDVIAANMERGIYQ